MEPPAIPPLRPATDPWLTQEWPTATDSESVADPPQAPESAQDAPTGQWAQFLQQPEADHEPPEAPTADLEDDGAAPAASTAWSSPVIGQRRGSAAALRSRRQIRSEDRTMSLVRYARPLAIAAGVLALAAIAGITAVRLPLGGGTATTSAEGGSLAASAAGADRAAAAAPPGAASPGAADANVGTVTLTSGQNYTQAKLAQQAEALTPASRKNAASSATGAPQAMEAMPSVAGNATLTDPAKLAECLAALNVDNPQPIAIDFARYEGGDAAIILLAARDGGYEVWAVSRTCGPDDSGVRGFVTIPAS